MTAPLKYLNDKRMRIVHLLYLLAFFSFCMDKYILILVLRVNYYFERYVWYTSYKNGLLAQPPTTASATAATTTTNNNNNNNNEGESTSTAAANARTRTRTRPTGNANTTATGAQNTDGPTIGSAAAALFPTPRPRRSGNNSNSNNNNNNNNNAAAAGSGDGSAFPGRGRRAAAAGADVVGEQEEEEEGTNNTGEIVEDGDLLVTKEMTVGTDNDTERYEMLNRSVYNRTLLHHPFWFSFFLYLIVVFAHVADLRWYYFNAKPHASNGIHSGDSAAKTATSLHQYHLAFAQDVLFWKNYDNSGLLTSYLTRWDAHEGLFFLPSVLPFLDIFLFLLECLAAALFSEKQEALIVDQYDAQQQQQQQLGLGGSVAVNDTNSGGSGGGGGCFSCCRSLKRKLFDGWTWQLFTLLPDKEEEMSNTVVA